VPVAVAGFCLKKEIDYFDKVMTSPTRPVVAIMGGAKVSDKIGVIDNLVKRMDKVLIGGGMMFTFLKAMGYEIGSSIVEMEMLDTRGIMRHARRRGQVLSRRLRRGDRSPPTPDRCPRPEIPPSGPASTSVGHHRLPPGLRTRTIMWNGPMGLFEMTLLGGPSSSHVLADSRPHHHRRRRRRRRRRRGVPNMSYIPPRRASLQLSGSRCRGSKPLRRDPEHSTVLPAAGSCLKSRAWRSPGCGGTGRRAEVVVARLHRFI
jgi:hypothetical protein